MSSLAHRTGRLTAFIAFVWLTQVLWRFIEVDAYLDAGGMVNRATGLCVASSPGDWSISENRPFLAWLVLLGIPALVVSAAYSAIGYAWMKAKMIREDA